MFDVLLFSELQLLEAGKYKVPGPIYIVFMNTHLVHLY